MNDFFAIDFSEISLMRYVGLLVLGAFIYTTLYIIKNHLFFLVVKSPVKRKKWAKKLPAIETLVWIFYAFYSFYVVVKPFPMFGVILALVSLYFARDYMYNLIHGLFFRLSNELGVGQSVSVDGKAGVIQKMNVFELELLNNEGELIQIPYRMLSRSEIIKKDFSTDFTSFKFSVVASNTISESFLMSQLIQMPWISTVILPQVSKTIQSENNTHFDVVVYPLHEKYNSFIENNLKKSISEDQN